MMDDGSIANIANKKTYIRQMFFVHVCVSLFCTILNQLVSILETSYIQKF